MFYSRILLVGILAVLFFSGCVTPNSSNTPPITNQSNSNPPAVDSSSPPLENGPGKVTFCAGDSAEENEECFEEALEDCSQAVATFWETSDGATLFFESQGLDSASGKCNVRVSVPSDANSSFGGKNAQCVITKKTSDSHPTGFFDVYDIGPSICTGTYVDAIVKSADESTNPPEENPPIENEPPSPPEKEFSFMVNESGVVGPKEFLVDKGDRVTLHITVDVEDVSFNGEQVVSPANLHLPADQYVFSTGRIAPGQTKDVTFIAEESIEFGVYWPGSGGALKGKGKVTLNP